jgi:hypothetical protein
MLKFRYKVLGGLMAGLLLAAAPLAADAALPRPVPLRNALLTAADLPGGYSSDASGSMAFVSDLATDTNICDRQVSHGSVNTAQATFIRGIPGPMLFETLSATGPRMARAIVAGIAAAPHRCRNLNDAGGAAVLRLSPMRVPRLGDAAAGLAFTVRPAAVNMTIQGRLISVARRGVTVTILLVNAPGKDQRSLNLIAATAIRKLDRVAF